MLTVIIDVSGGVAEIAECPPEVEVIIRDYDNCEVCSDDPDSDYPCPDYCPDHGQ